MKPNERAELYVRITRKLAVMRQDLTEIHEAEANGALPGGIWTNLRLCQAIDAVTRIEADYRGIAMGHLQRAGRQAPLF